MEKKRIIFLVTMSVVIVVAGVVGIAVYYALREEGSSSTDDSLVNCLPQLSDPTREQCREKEYD